MPYTRFYDEDVVVWRRADVVPNPGEWISITLTLEGARVEASHRDAIDRLLGITFDVPSASGFWSVRSA